MKIDITSLCFGFKIEKDNDSGTAAWATSIGQAPKDICYIDTNREGLDEIVYGMMYKSHSDFDNLKVRDITGLDKREEPRGDRERMMFSVFEDVYVNNMKVDGIYTLTYEREDTPSHKNRLHICYAKYLTYKGHSNKDTLKEMAQKLGCSEDACWFITDISIKKQSKLLFTAIVVNPTKTMIYADSKARKKAWESLVPEIDNSLHENDTLQQIFYGAPGTGKSNTIKREVDDNGKLNFRTTFHPDSDYSTFVGCYKPKMKRSTITKDGVTTTEEKIVYNFEPQAFTNAYVQAWTTKEDVYLIIEEINRGNCAQIFGDLFQLLDRKDGESEYPVDADSALADYLQTALVDSERDDIPIEVQNGTKLKLPSNLFIWATMNTSDQSLFPIDSAFKRRWDWVYMPIDTAKETWYIKIGESYYSWTKFLDKVNDELLTDETAEDKHLGFYFCKATEKKNGTESGPNVITAETFVGKVLFYLWNDVFKVYGIHSKIGNSKDWPYRKFYQTNGKVDEGKVAELMKKLEIAAEGSNEEKEEETEDQ